MERDQKSMIAMPKEAAAFKDRFKDFANEIILEGKETEEIANRPIISDRYDEAMWLQAWFVLKYWLDDRSPRFEKTDAAIEKSVNLAFDLMGKSAIDSFLDFAKVSIPIQIIMAEKFKRATGYSCFESSARCKIYLYRSKSRRELCKALCKKNGEPLNG